MRLGVREREWEEGERGGEEEGRSQEHQVTNRKPTIYCWEETISGWGSAGRREQDWHRKKRREGEGGKERATEESKDGDG